MGGGAIRAKVNIETRQSASGIYVSANNADLITDNSIYYHTGKHITNSGGHYPIMYVNNTGSRPKNNNYHIEIDQVEMDTWYDSNRGIIQARSVSHGFDSCNIVLRIGQGIFKVNSALWSLVAFMPFNASVGNTVKVHCDNCEFYNKSALAANEFIGQNTDLFVITGKYKTYSRQTPLFIARNEGRAITKQRTIFDGEFIGTDTTLFVLPVSHTYEFRGYYRNDEADDRIIVANWSSTGTQPTLRNCVFDSPATTPIESNIATVWYVADARSTTAITKDADITFTPLFTYDDPVNLYTANGTIPTGTTRYINFGTGGVYGYMGLGGGTSNAQIDAVGYNYKYNADWAFNPYAAANATAGHGFSNMNMYSRLYGGAGQRFARMYQEAFRNSTTSGYQMTNYMNIYMQNARKFMGLYNNMDSIGNVMRSGILFKSDSITTGGRSHFAGFLENGYPSSGLERTYHPNSFWGLQTTTYNSSTRYNWFGADDLDAGTIGTGNKVFMYGGATTGYYFPNATPSVTSGDVSIINWIGTGAAVTPRITRIGDAFSLTARVIPYANSNGRMVLGNTYFRLDTTTTAGALARNRLNINKTFDISSPDSYTVLDVTAGDAATAGANFFIGDQTVGYITAGYDARVMVYRYGTSLSAATNLGAVLIGRYGFGGWINGARNNDLGGMFLSYVGNGTNTLTDMDFRTNGGLVGLKIYSDQKVGFGEGGDNYYVPNASPNNTSGAKSELIFTGTGVAGGTPSAFVERRFGNTGAVAADASGQITISFPSMPDATYRVVILNNGATPYLYSVISKGTGSFILGAFTDAGVPVAVSTSLNVDWDIIDY